jgi:hypothetical protein
MISTDGDSHCCAFLILLTIKNHDCVKSGFLWQMFTTWRNYSKKNKKCSIFDFMGFDFSFFKIKILKVVTYRPSLSHGCKNASTHFQHYPFSAPCKKIVVRFNIQ